MKTGCEVGRGLQPRDARLLALFWKKVGPSPRLGLEALSCFDILGNCIIRLGSYKDLFQRAGDSGCSEPSDT